MKANRGEIWRVEFDPSTGQELAEGFECAMEDPNYLAIYFKGKEAIIDSPLVFSTLIHRAVEGWNKKHYDDLDDRIIHISGEDVSIPDWEYGQEFSRLIKQFEDYTPSSLTHAECAMLHCLQDILDRESR